jgi:UDP-glucose 4-epimerase
LTDIEQNVTPQVGFIENCILAGVKNFIFISSGGTIYGPPATLPIPEDHPANPINSYGMTKLVVEKYLRMLTRDTEMAYTILRVANPFGPGQHSTKGQGLIPSVLKSHFRGQPTTIYGDGSNLRDYLYIDDLIEALCAALAAPAVFGPLNIGSGVGRSVMEVVEAVGTALGTSIELRFLPDRPTDLKVNVLDISRAREFLSWEPRMPFADGVAMTVSAFLTENVA